MTTASADSAVDVTRRTASFVGERGVTMLPMLLWILGVPGLIIILLLLLGVIHI